MAAPDLQWVAVKDFSPGIRHIVSPNQPPGAADTAGTWGCVVTDAGVLTASPGIQQSFVPANPDTPGTIQSEQFRITGLHVQSPIANNGGAGTQETGPNLSEAEVFLMYEWYKADIRHTKLDRLIRYTIPTRWENIWDNGGVAVPYSDFIRPRNCFFMTGRSNNADVNRPGYPVIGWNADDQARFWPDDSSAVAAATNATVQLPVDPDSAGNLPVGCVSHQGRAVIFPLHFYDHGLASKTATNEQFFWSAVNDWRTIDPVFPSIGAVSVSYDDTGGGFQIFASMTANELLLGKGRGGAVMVRGDLDNFQVVTLPNFMSCGYSLNVGCKSPIGWVYPVDNGTVWVWSGGDRCQNIADYMEPNFWRPVYNIPAYGASPAASGYGFAATSMCSWGKYIVLPNNWMYDTVKNSWWRMEEPLNMYHNYHHVATDATQRWLYATPSGWTDTSTPAVYEYDMMRKNTTYYWLSHPLEGTNDRHVTVREVILDAQVDPNFGLFTGNVTVTVTSDQDPVGQSAIYAIGNASYQVHSHRSPYGFGVSGTNIRVQLQSTTDGGTGNAAPRIHGFRVGLAEQQRLPRSTVADA